MFDKISICNFCGKKKKKLTVQPFGIVFESAFECVFTSAGRVVVQVGAEDDSVGFGEFGIGAGIESRQIARIAAFHPHGRRIVARIERAFSDAHTDARHVFISTQMCQIGLLSIKEK